METTCKQAPLAKIKGLWARYDANGNLYDEGVYSNDEKTGDWKTYDSSGKLSKTKSIQRETNKSK